MLFVCSIFSFLDRQILSLVVIEIRRDLGLSEVQVGLLQGLPFAVFYEFMSIEYDSDASNSVSDSRSVPLKGSLPVNIS